MKSMHGEHCYFAGFTEMALTVDSLPMMFKQVRASP